MTERALSGYKVVEFGSFISSGSPGDALPGAVRRCPLQGKRGIRSSGPPENELGGGPWITWKLSETPGSIRQHAPLVGEDNRYVFRDLLGLSESEVAQLEEKKVIY